MIIVRLVIILFNAAVLTMYLAFMDIDSRLLSGTLFFLLAFCFLTLLFLKSGKPSVVILHNFQLSIGVILFFFCAFDPHQVHPSLVPVPVRYFLNRYGQAEYVEYLDKNPYILIKPGVIVRSSGYRGSNDQFVYEWKTDRKGFKNLPEFENLKKYKATAVGDSFTEGMGVATEKTWTTLLSKSGYPTYNLGVQSYAPSQFEGVFSIYGPQCSAEYVLIGYTGGIYVREAMLWGAENLKDKESVRQYIRSKPAVSLLDEIRHSAKYLPSAIFLFSRYTVKQLFSQEGKVKQTPATFDKRFLPYKHEILSVGSEKDLKRINDLSLHKREWERTLSAFLKIKESALAIGAKTVIIYFPHRGEMYYEKAMARPLPPIYFEQHERELMRAFAEKNGMGFIDISPAILNYIHRLPLDRSYKDYPYLEIDGHLSDVGNFLAAQEIKNYFKGKDK